MGGNNPKCDDPFNSTEFYSRDASGMYQKECYAGMSNNELGWNGEIRSGLYPANKCLKIKGHFGKINSKM